MCTVNKHWFICFLKNMASKIIWGNTIAIVKIDVPRSVAQKNGTTFTRKWADSLPANATIIEIEVKKIEVLCSSEHIW